ncbi:MAG: hypothetical protein ACLS9T_07760 [Streptococcus salivarius]
MTYPDGSGDEVPVSGRSSKTLAQVRTRTHQQSTTQAPKAAPAPTSAYNLLRHQTRSAC